MPVRLAANAIHTERIPSQLASRSTPRSALPFGTVCTLTVTAAQITPTQTIRPTAWRRTSPSRSRPWWRNAAPAVTTTTPANGAANVAVDSTIVINFSESVTASASAFSIQCPAGSPQAFAQSASPASVVHADAASPLPYSTTCTVTVAADQISDTDTNDPPDQMASDVSFSFTTAPAAAGAGKRHHQRGRRGHARRPTRRSSSSCTTAASATRRSTAWSSSSTTAADRSGNQSYAAFDLDGYSTDANGYFVAGQSRRAGRQPDVRSGRVRAAAERRRTPSRSTSATRPTSRTARPSRRRTCRTPSSTAPTIRTTSGLLPLLNAGQPQVNENADGSGTTQSSQRCPNGTGGFRNTSRSIAGAPTPGAANSCPAPRADHSDVVISQIYGGGGNAGATYHNDYVELYNRGAAPGRPQRLVAAVRVGDGQRLGLQQAAARRHDRRRRVLPDRAGVGRRGRRAAAAGEHHRPDQHERHAAARSRSSTASTRWSATVRSATRTSWTSSATAAPTAAKGSTTAPAPSNTTAIFRQGNGSTDTDSNGDDFVTRRAESAPHGADRRARAARAEHRSAHERHQRAARRHDPGDLHRAGRRGRRLVRHHVRQQRSAQQRDVRRQRRQDHYITPNVNFTAGRAVHGHDLQGPGSRSGSGRQRAEHRHAAGELRLVVHGGDRHRAAVPAERAPDDGQSERRDRRASASRTTT